MPNVKLDHAVIHVSDWGRSNAFYHDVLGAEVVPARSGWAYRFGEEQLNLHGPGSSGRALSSRRGSTWNKTTSRSSWVPSSGSAPGAPARASTSVTLTGPSSSSSRTRERSRGRP